MESWIPKPSEISLLAFQWRDTFEQKQMLATIFDVKNYFDGFTVQQGERTIRLVRGKEYYYIAVTDSFTSIVQFGDYIYFDTTDNMRFGFMDEKSFKNLYRRVD